MTLIALHLPRLNALLGSWYAIDLFLVYFLYRMYLQSLSLMLQNEQWKNAAKPGSASIELSKAVANSPIFTPRFNDEGFVHNFEEWVKQGNPFVHSNASKSYVGKRLWNQVNGLKEQEASM